MATTVELPQVGESVTEGVVTKWLKQPGDVVARYDPLVEVETDKVTMEVPSPIAGKFVKALVKEGDTVPMGAPLCEVEETAQPRARAAASPATIGRLAEPGPGFGATGAQPEEAGTGVGHPRMSPVVQRIAAEHGVPLDEVASIRGTGFEGRVTKQDMIRHVQERAASGAGAATAAAPAQAAPPAAPVTSAPPASTTMRPQPRPAERPLTSDEEAIPLTPVRRRIAENMMRSVRDIPTAWTVFEVDVTQLVKWRNAVLEDFEKREGVHLTYLPFVLKAVAETLRQQPVVNSSWGGERIIVKKRINVGIAVAAPQGLVVPVIHDADQYSIAGLARKSNELITKARENRLSLQNVQGGTFTVNNAGALGSMVSHPIIFYPQAAIMTLEAIVRKPVAIGDAIALRDRMNFTFTFDHRVMDGQDAGAFMSSVKRRVEGMGPESSLY